MSKKGNEPRPYRGVQDEIRQQQAKTKDMTPKERLQYFWYYYKVHTIVFIVAILFLATLIRDVRSSRDYAFYGIMLNAAGLSGEAMEAAFGEYAGLDLENYDCLIDADAAISYRNPGQFDMATSQKLIAQVQAKDLDAVVFDYELFDNYAGNEMFCDLRTVFTEQELQAYQADLYYIDQAEILRREEDPNYRNDMFNADAPTAEELLRQADAHRHPENMEQPIPVGIFLTDSPFAQKTGAYGGLQPIFGIVVNTTRPETAKKYLAFLCDENIDFTSMLTNYFAG